MEALLDRLQQIAPLSEPLKYHLHEKLKTRKFSKKEYLLKAGHICQYIWFIEAGLVRCFYEKDEKEVCSWFMKEYDVIISVQSFFEQSVSYENIQTLEDTTVYYISYNDLQSIYQQYPEFNVHGRILTEKYYALSEKRLFYMRMHTALERYSLLIKHAPELVLRVSNTDIASYLGITIETLSRIKKDL